MLKLVIVHWIVFYQILLGTASWCVWYGLLIVSIECCEVVTIVVQLTMCRNIHLHELSDLGKEVSIYLCTFRSETEE